MPAIDSLLSLVVQQGADELRLGTDVAPRMFQMGAARKLAVPITSDETLRALLGPLLDDERERALRASGRAELSHACPDGSAFHTVFTVRDTEGGRLAFDVVFLRGGRPRAPSPPQPGAPLAAPAPPPAMAPSVATAAAAPQVAAPPPPPAPMVAAPTPVPGETATPQLAVLLSRARGQRASDLHLQDGKAPVARIDGTLRPLGASPIESVAEVLGGALDDRARDALAAGRSADLALEVGDLGRFRVNVYAAAGGLCAAIRALPRTPPLLIDLRLPLPIDDLASLPNGLVIVCGPTGSGKSTTLASLALESARQRPQVLLTLEDPIEYVIPETRGLVRQRQIGRDACSFASGLRDAMREDPDVLLLGEMRDPETIQLALTASETGHLVLTSLHARSAASAIERVLDACPPERQAQVRLQLADALRAVVVQRLLPHASGKGRVLAMEVLRGNTNVAGLVREGKTSQIATAIQSSRKEGMLPLERSLADLVRAGEIRVEDAEAVANDRAALMRYLGP